MVAAWEQPHQGVPAEISFSCGVWDERCLHAPRTDRHNCGAAPTLAAACTSRSGGAATQQGLRHDALDGFVRDLKISTPCHSTAPKTMHVPQLLGSTPAYSSALLTQSLHLSHEIPGPPPGNQVVAGPPPQCVKKLLRPAGGLLGRAGREGRSAGPQGSRLVGSRAHKWEAGWAAMRSQ
jgi:hypothetical protein